MSLNVNQKSEVINDARRHDSDTGSPEVQVSLLTKRIKHLESHFKAHKKDAHSRRGLLRMISLRRSLLDYLKAKNPEAYQALIKRLELRR